MGHPDVVLLGNGSDGGSSGASARPGARPWRALLAAVVGHRHRDAAGDGPYAPPAVVCRCGAVYDDRTGTWHPVLGR